MKKRVENKGFTLIELLVTVAILGILAAILVPSYVQYIGSTKAKACEVNRLQFVHSFKVYKVYDGGNYSLADAVNGSISALSAEKAGLKCPSGGTITASGNTISCSLHGDLTVDMSDIGGGGTPGGESPDPGGGGTSGGLDLNSIAGSWTDLYTDLNKVIDGSGNKKWGANLALGSVFKYGENYYAVYSDKPAIHTKDLKESLDEYAATKPEIFAKLAFNKVYYSENDETDRTTINNSTTWTRPLTKGAVYVKTVGDNKSYYVCRKDMSNPIGGANLPGEAGYIWALLKTPAYS